MDTSDSLFARTRPGKPIVKKIRGFLALPGEVRNQIYGYYFRSDLRCEFVAKGCQLQNGKPRTVKLWAGREDINTSTFKSDETRVESEVPLTVRTSRHLGNYNTVQGLQTNWPKSSYALNLVCKQVYTETLPFIYQKTIFIFNAPRKLNNFLHVVSKPKLELITKLHLHYITYGAPKHTEHIHWQDRHVQSWISTCKAVSKKLHGLRELEILVHVNHSPLRFSLREKWITPLLQFRRLGFTSTRFDMQTASNSHVRLQKGLESVKVHIHSRWSKDPLLAFNNNIRLVKASADLHLLFGRAIAAAIRGAKEVEAMAEFNTAWTVTHRHWQYHLGYAKIGW